MWEEPGVQMVRIVIRRLLWSIPMVWAVSALSFVLASLAPGNGARAILGMNSSPEAYAQVRAQLGLNRPVYVQYWDWLTHALRGDLGPFDLQRSVSDIHPKFQT
jgi:peptide/nickel transport system permease protein